VTLATGRPSRDLLTALADPGFAGCYLRGMAEVARPVAGEVAAHLAARRPTRVLDVGAGPASFAMALRERCPDVHVTLLDLPETVAVARTMLTSGPRDQCLTHLEGNYNEVDFGEKQYDMILFSHVTHDEGEEENRVLFRKACKALQPGGTVAVHDFVVNEERTGPVFHALLAAHLRTFTAAGRVYTINEYMTWLSSAGFGGLEINQINSDAENSSVLLTGVKGDERCQPN
jgi:ubiquinone/menaquinone biosynthesis C-methylase UbiE